MTTTEYDIGQAIIVTFTWRRASDSALTDPTTSTYTLLDNAGTSTTLSATHVSTGIYTVTFTPTAAGTWAVKGVGTGAVADSEWAIYVVRPGYAWDLLAVLTLDEAKRGINLDTSDATYDVELLAMVSGISQALDTRCGPIVNRTVTSELHDGGCHLMRPRKTPVAAMTTVVEYSNTTATTLAAETNATKTASDYLLENDGFHDVVIRRRASNADSWFPAGRDNVALTYSAGRAATTALVDQRFKLAAKAMLRRIWGLEHGAGGNRTFREADVIPTLNIPVVQQLLAKDLLVAALG